MFIAALFIKTPNSSSTEEWIDNVWDNPITHQTVRKTNWGYTLQFRESSKCNVRQNKPDTKEYILQNIIYRKFKTLESWLVTAEVRPPAAWGGVMTGGGMSGVSGALCCFLSECWWHGCVSFGKICLWLHRFDILNFNY